MTFSLKNLKMLGAGMVALFSVYDCEAESYMFDNPDNKATLGVRVSLDISSAANGGAYYNNRAGFSAGAVYNIPLWMNLYFEPGVSVFYNTFGTSAWDEVAVDVPVLDSAGAPVIGPDGNPVMDSKLYPYQIDGSIRNFGFRIPMMAGYHFDFTEDVKVHVFTGPQLNLSLLARYHRNAVRVSGAEEPAASCSLFGTEGFKHIDLQWAFGVGVTYQNYYLSLGGAWGLTHMKSSTELLGRDLRRNMFSISLGYNF